MGALFSGCSAGWLHSLDFPPCDPIEVTLPRLSETSHLSGVRLTRSDFTADEVCEVRGLPATSRDRTVADLARRGSVVEGVVVLDMALRSRVVTAEQLDAWIAGHPRYRGVRRLAKALELADPASESPMESRLRALILTAGLPRPRVQETLYDEQGSFVARADLLYPDERLVIEYDDLTHRTSLTADDQRHNRLTDAGYRVLRFTAGDVLHRPASVVGQVRRALAYSRGSPN